MILPKTLLFFLALPLIISSFCLEPRVRKPWSELSLNDKDLFVNAIWQLKRNGIYDTFVDVHSSNTHIHGTSSFLPWHRWFLWKFEESIRNLGEEYKCLTIPYWDWENDKGDEEVSPVFGHHFGSKTSTDCVSDGYFSFSRGWSTSSGTCLKRFQDNDYGFVGQTQILGLLLKNEKYGDFRVSLESSPYASVRHFLGGLNAEDPLFFLHLANIDRLWAIWEDCRDFDKVDLLNLKNDDHPVYEATLLEDLLLATLPFYSSTGQQVALFYSQNGKFPNARDLLFIEQNSLSEVNYSYAKDSLVQLIEKRFPQYCHWDWFDSETKVQKRSLLSEEAVEGYRGDDDNSWEPRRQNRYSSNRFNNYPQRSQYYPQRNQHNPQRNQYNPLFFTLSFDSPSLNTYQPRYRSNPYQFSSSSQNMYRNRNRYNNPYRLDFNQNLYQTRFNNPYQFSSSFGRNYFSDFYPSQNWQFQNRDSSPRHNFQFHFDIDLDNLRVNQNSRNSDRFRENSDENNNRNRRGDRRNNDRRNDDRRGKFSNEKSEDAWEKVDEILPNADPLAKINIVAIVECLANGRKKHASEEWIKLNHMENVREVFDPICPELKCCKISDIFSTAMVCNSGEIATMNCSSDCDWRYDCEVKNSTQSFGGKKGFLNLEADSDVESGVGILSPVKYFGLIVFGFMLLF